MELDCGVIISMMLFIIMCTMLLGYILPKISRYRRVQFFIIPQGKIILSQHFKEWIAIEDLCAYHKYEIWRYVERRRQYIH